MALASLLPLAPDPADLLRSMRRSVIDHLLKSLSSGKRTDLLNFIADKHIFVLPVLDQETLAAIAMHIIEITRNWKWL